MKRLTFRELIYLVASIEFVAGRTNTEAPWFLVLCSLLGHLLMEYIVSYMNTYEHAHTHRHIHTTYGRL